MPCGILDLSQFVCLLMLLVLSGLQVVVWWSSLELSLNIVFSSMWLTLALHWVLCILVSCCGGGWCQLADLACGWS